MTDESKKDVNKQPDTDTESSSDEEEVDNNRNDYADGAIVEALAENIHNLAVESDLEEDDNDDNESNATPSAHTPPLPFELDDYSDEEFPDMLSDDDDNEREGIEHLLVNSPRLYAQIRQYLTEHERVELWSRTPWVVKWTWDSEEPPSASDPSDVPYKEQTSFSLF